MEEQEATFVYLLWSFNSLNPFWSIAVFFLDDIKACEDKLNSSWEF